MGRNREDLQALAILQVRGLKYEQCAEELGRSKRQLIRWSKLPEFQHIWRELQETWLATAQAQVSEAGSHAVVMLMWLAEDARSEHVRYLAAKQLGEWAGLGQPQGEHEHDDRQEVIRVLDLIQQRNAQREVAARQGGEAREFRE